MTAREHCETVRTSNKQWLKDEFARLANIWRAETDKQSKTALRAATQANWLLQELRERYRVMRFWECYQPG